MFIQPNWPAPPSVRAYTTLRHGAGKSAAPYQSFNLGLHVEDEVEQVKANRQELSQRLQLPAEPLWLKQTHSNLVVEALPTNREQVADASFTRTPHQVCAIMTADCLPILICDSQGQHAAAIHAGWRGLAKGIIQNTLERLGLDNQSLLAWLGPAIGPEKFEVGQEVYDCFSALAPVHQTAFRQTSANTWLADIYELARQQLRALGLNQIYGGDYCTYTEATDFFSYRRDRITGRMASLIWLES